MAARSGIHRPSIIDGKYAHTSVSQIKDMEACPRLWYTQKLIGLQKPAKPSQELGNKVHEALEYYELHGEIKDDEFAEYVVAAQEHLDPLLGFSDNFSIEREILRPTFEGGPRLVGYKDLEVVSGDRLLILDHKTTSDRKYAKTPLELAEDLQLNIYAKDAFDEHPELNVIGIAHLYFLTKNKKKVAWPVYGEVTRESAQAAWEKAMVTVREMCRIVAWHYGQKKPVDRFEELTPETNSCTAYGGCYFRRRCGIGVEKINFSVDSLLRKTKPTGEKMPSLSEKLAAKKNGTVVPMSNISTKDTVVDMPQGALIAPLSVLPPDAPSQNEVYEEPPKASKGKRAKGPKPESINLEDFKTPTVAELNEAAKAPASVGRRRLVILEGCIPLKGDYSGYVLFADWIAPIMQAVAEEHGVADYRLIQYTAKAALATKIRQSLDTVPEVLVIDGYASGSSEALEVLVPHATLVIKSLK